MRWVPLALAAPLPSAAASADCHSDTAVAMQRANALPPTAGRAALMEQIQRAEVAHHEGDEEDCVEQLSDATSVLDSIDDAKKRAATPDTSPKTAPRDDQKKSGAQGRN